MKKQRAEFIFVPALTLCMWVRRVALKHVKSPYKAGVSTEIKQRRQRSNVSPNVRRALRVVRVLQQGERLSFNFVAPRFNSHPRGFAASDLSVEP
jgi:hypothetical protein